MSPDVGEEVAGRRYSKQSVRLCLRTRIPNLSSQRQRLRTIPAEMSRDFRNGPPGRLVIADNMSRFRSTAHLQGDSPESVRRLMCSTLPRLQHSKGEQLARFPGQPLCRGCSSSSSKPVPLKVATADKDFREVRIRFELLTMAGS